MDELYVIAYKLADGKRIRLEVTGEVKELIEQSDRQIRSQRRQDRRHLLYTGCIDEFDDHSIAEAQEDVADLLVRMDSYKRLYAAIDKLSEDHRRRVYLYYYCGLTCREIADTEKVHHSTVSRCLRQARDELRKHLTE